MLSLWRPNSAAQRETSTMHILDSFYTSFPFPVVLMKSLCTTSYTIPAIDSDLVLITAMTYHMLSYFSNANILGLHPETLYIYLRS